MDEDAFEAQLRSSLLSYFQHLAEQLGELAELQFVDEDPEPHGFDSDYEGTVGHWSLRPANPDAAEVQWHATESDAYSTYLALGRYTWVEVLTLPKKQSPTEAAAETIEVVRRGHRGTVPRGGLALQVNRATREQLGTDQVPPRGSLAFDRGHLSTATAAPQVALPADDVLVRPLPWDSMIDIR